MNFNTKDALYLKVSWKDEISVYENKLPVSCVNCNSLISTETYSINGGIKAHKCNCCGRLFVEYQQWLYMPNRDSYNIVNEDLACTIRSDNYTEKRLDEKIKDLDKRIKYSYRKLNATQKQKEKQEREDQRKLAKVIKEKNGEALGHLPKQRKRSIFS